MSMKIMVMTGANYKKSSKHTKHPMKEKKKKRSQISSQFFRSTTTPVKTPAMTPATALPPATTPAMTPRMASSFARTQPSPLYQAESLTSSRELSTKQVATPSLSQDWNSKISYARAIRQNRIKWKKVGCTSTPALAIKCIMSEKRNAVSK